MKSHTNQAFRKLFANLPEEVREQARAAYRLFRSYRAVGILPSSDEVVWFWIGPHEQYETLLYTL